VSELLTLIGIFDRLLWKFGSGVDGVFSSAAVANMCSRLLMDGTEMAEVLSNLFQRADVDQDGMVSRSDWAKFVTTLGIPEDTLRGLDEVSIKLVANMASPVGPASCQPSFGTVPVGTTVGPTSGPLSAPPQYGYDSFGTTLHEAVCGVGTTVLPQPCGNACNQTMDAMPQSYGYGAPCQTVEQGNHYGVPCHTIDAMPYAQANTFGGLCASNATMDALPPVTHYSGFDQGNSGGGRGVEGPCVWPRA